MVLLAQLRIAYILIFSSWPVLSAIAAPSASVPDENGQVISLVQAQTLALQYQPRQQVWQQRSQLVQGQAQQAGLQANPQLTVEQTGLERTQEREFSVAVAQQLDVFGERKVRQQLSLLGVEQEQLNQDMSQAQLKLTVSQAYWQLAQAEWALQLAEQQQILGQQSLKVAKKRLEAGRIAALEYHKVQLEQQQQQQQWQAVQNQLHIARLQLGQWWGDSTVNLFKTGQPLQFPVSQSITINAPNLGLQYLHQQQKQAEVALHLARIQARPQPTLSLGYVRTRESNTTDAQSQRIALGVSVPLPLFNQNQGTVREQQAMLALSQGQAHLYQQQIQQQIQQKQLTLQLLAQQYQQLTQQQLPLAQQVQQKTQTGFEAGKFSVLDVQQASRDYQQLQSRQLNLLQQGWQLSLELQALALGLPIADMPQALPDQPIAISVNVPAGEQP
ncbi:TolC family protein [Alkanindiges sp. WGS2144]|uniref:TolC family protein n=1 Tax=Alkanindiges sp. WGS2144 TaxID=3366808 RepID=UPI003751E2D8